MPILWSRAGSLKDFIGHMNAVKSILNGNKGGNEMSKKKKTILPYALRKKIWDFIQQGKTNHQIVEEVFKGAEPHVTSDAQFIQCISFQRSLYTRGIKSNPKSLISSLGAKG